MVLVSTEKYSGRNAFEQSSYQRVLRLSITVQDDHISLSLQPVVSLKVIPWQHPSGRTVLCSRETETFAAIFFLVEPQFFCPVTPSYDNQQQ